MLSTMKDDLIIIQIVVHVYYWNHLFFISFVYIFLS